MRRASFNDASAVEMHLFLGMRAVVGLISRRKRYRKRVFFDKRRGSSSEGRIG